MYANKLQVATTRRAIENTNTSYSQVLGPGASRNPPDPHKHFLFCSFVVEGTHGSSEPMCLLVLNGCRESFLCQCTIYNDYTIKPLINLGLTRQKAKLLATVSQLSGRPLAS
eukprot:1160765-Pelagomonas_calceolata.AAC.6